MQSEPKIKKFRSSKILKPLDHQPKQQSHLRTRIKILEQQIEMLQKSNLNIFIPMSEQVQPTQDYQSIIKQLRIKIVSLQNQNQGHKYQIKKLEKQKEQLKKQHVEEIKKIRKQVQVLTGENKQLNQRNQQLQQDIEKIKNQCDKLESSLIEKNVQLKFLSEELHQQKIRYKNMNDKYNKVIEKINAVIYSSRIYKSLEIKCLCIEKSEYDELKNKILMLEAEIQKLKREKNRELVSLGYRRNDIGEQIVRLKKNIDLQLGLQGNSKHSEDFLKVYKGTQQLFDNLIEGCQK